MFFIVIPHLFRNPFSITMDSCLRRNDSNATSSIFQKLQNVTSSVFLKCSEEKMYREVLQKQISSKYFSIQNSYQNFTRSDVLVFIEISFHLSFLPMQESIAIQKSSTQKPFSSKKIPCSCKMLKNRR